MQGFLITVATAVMLAIAAAFAAPFVVDWTAWRATFEAEASRTLGLPVQIRGGIDAELLPSPKLTLRSVSIGTDPTASGGTVEVLHAEFSLGALMRGQVEARGVTLTRPSLRLVLDSSGRLREPPGSVQPAASVSIERLAVQDGTLDFVEAADGRTTRASAINLKGDLRDFTGPFRLEGEADAFGARRSVRLAVGKAAAEGARVRFIADQGGRTFDLDGLLRFDRGSPVFEGKGTFAQQGGAAGFWRISGPLRVTPEAGVMEGLDLTLGDEARPVQLSGSARLSLSRALALDAVLNARAVDADTLFGAGPGTTRAPVEGFAALSGAFSRLPETPFPVRVGMAVDQLTIGGTVVREARLDLAGAPSGWRIDTAEAKLPGQTALRLSGAASPRGGASFAGDLALRTPEPATFLRWAAPRAPAAYAAMLDGPLQLSSRIEVAGDRIVAQNIQLGLGTARLTGEAGLAFGTPARLTLALALEGVDLDPLLAAAREGIKAAGPNAIDGEIRLQGRNLRLSSLPMGGLSLTTTGAGGTWDVSRLALEDFSGLRLSGSGAFTRLVAPVAGQMTLKVEGAKADGLESLARIVAGPEAGDMLARLQPVAAPVALETSSMWKADGSSQVSAEGTLGLLSGRMAISRGRNNVPEKIDLAVAASDAGRALEAAGVSGLRPGLGAGRLDLAVVPVASGAGATFDGRLSVADAAVSGSGRVRFLADGAMEPQGRMRLEGPDLARIFAPLAALDAGAVPARLTFDVAREPGRWRFENVEGMVAGAPIAGAVQIEGGTPPRLVGSLGTESLSLPRLLGILAARPTGDAGAGPWSMARLNAPAPMPVGLSLDLQAKRIDLSDLYALADGRLRLTVDPQVVEVRDLSGTFGGGAFSGLLSLRRRADLFVAEGRLMLENADAAAILAPLAPRVSPTGRVTLALDLLGTGRTPLAVVQSLSGQGTLFVRNLTLPGTDPAAISAVLADTTVGPPPDERRTAQMLDRALQRGPLRLEQVETALSVVNGAVRLSPARAEVTLPTGVVRSSFSGTFDMARLLMDISLSLETGDSTEAGGTVQWRGPVTMPERRVTAVALANAIALRAIERETRRLDERHGAAPVQPAAPAPPAPPAVSPPPSSAVPPPASSAPAASAGTSTSAPPSPPVRPAPPRQTDARPVRAAPAVPPLAPPQEIGPVTRPQAVRPELDEIPYARPSSGGLGTLPRPPGLLPAE